MNTPQTNGSNDRLKLLATGAGIVVFAFSAICVLCLVFDDAAPVAPTAAPAAPAAPDAPDAPDAAVPTCAVGVVMGGGPRFDGTEPPDTGFQLRDCPTNATPHCSSLPGEYMLCFPDRAGCDGWRSNGPADLPAAVPCYPAPEWAWCIDLPARRCFPSVRACAAFRRRWRDRLRIEPETTCIRRHTM